MAHKNSFYSISVCLFFGLISIVGNGYAAQPEPGNNQAPRIVSDDGWIHNLERGWGRPTMSKPLQRIKELKAIPGAFAEIENRIRDLKANLNKNPEHDAPLNKQIAAWTDAEQDLLNILKNDHKYGKAIALGLAGSDAKLLQELSVESISEGIQLGFAMRGSRAVSDGLGKRIENSIDRVLGGIWDAIISTIIDSWNTVYEVIFHASGEPFTLKDIKGWQDLIKSSFEDMALLLKDGFKDSLRGHDMTLRQAPADAVVETEEEGVNGWYVIASGYVRQFDYIIHQLDKHLVYYNGNDMVAFYVGEIKRQLLETNKLLMMCESLKELDTILDSNKSIIPALRKNILNLFTRLADLIEPQGLSSGQSAIRSSSSLQDSSRRESSSRYDDSGPRSFRPY